MLSTVAPALPGLRRRSATAPALASLLRTQPMAAPNPPPGPEGMSSSAIAALILRPTCRQRASSWEASSRRPPRTWERQMVDTDRITGAAREIGGKVQAAVGDLAGDRRAQVEGQFREAQGQAENLAGQARDGLRDAADTAIDYAEDAYERGRHAARHGARTVTHAVEETPLLALLLAGAVGYGLALLVHGRR